MSDFTERVKAVNSDNEFMKARVDRRAHKRYRDAITGEFVTKDEADARPNETVGETVWVAVATDDQVEAAAEAIFKLRYPNFEYMRDDWALAYARVALDAAAEARA